MNVIGAWFARMILLAMLGGDCLLFAMRQEGGGQEQQLLDALRKPTKNDF